MASAGRLACIVEGDGEKRALPTLVHRIAAEILGLPSIIVNPIWVIPKDQLIKPTVLEARINAIIRQSEQGTGVLVLLDADKHLPCVLGPNLLNRAQAERPDISLAVVIARSEFENWFIAAAESLAGIAGLPDSLCFRTLEPKPLRQFVG